MAIKVKLGELVSAEPALNRLMALQLPIKAAYNLAKLTAAVRTETKIFYEQRGALIKKLGEERDPTEAEVAKGGHSKVFEVTPDNMEEYSSKISELVDIEVTIDRDLFAIDSLGDVGVSGEDIIAIYPLISETQDASRSTPIVPSAKRSKRR